MQFSRGVLLLSYLAGLCTLSSCHPSFMQEPENGWRFEPGNACSPCFETARAVLPACLPCSHLSFQIVRDPCGYYFTVSTECFYFCDPCACSLPVPVEISCDDEPTMYMGWALQGGQRVVLSEEAQEALINALLCGECPKVKVGTLNSIVSSACFRKVYRDLMQ